jgi:hypothetical protein
MNLKDEWERLDSETRNWLLENPGCVILPRTMSARIVRDASGKIDCDRHGQIPLSREDLDFIREKSHGTGSITTEHRFFDANQP